MPIVIQQPGKFRLTMRTKEFSKHARNVMEGRIEEAAEMVALKVVENITEFETAEVGPSEPGEFPHADTHELAESVHPEVDGMTGRVVADAPHALFVEYGTRNMEERPYLRRTLAEMEPELRRHFGQRMPVMK